MTSAFPTPSPNLNQPPGSQFEAPGPQVGQFGVSGPQVGQLGASGPQPGQFGVPVAPVQFQEQPCPPSCPMGLQYLIDLNAVYIQQDIQILELALRVEMNNKYSVFNPLGELIYRAQENNDFLTLNYAISLGSSRPFELNMFDVNSNAIRYDCPTTGFQQEVATFDPTGQLLGIISQTEASSGCCQCQPEFIVRDAQRNPIFLIITPTSTCCNCELHVEYSFPIMTMDKVHQVGAVSKQWSGYVQEIKTDADNFMVTFPPDLDVRLKAVLIGGCFLIDYIFYEQKARHANSSSRRRRSN